MSQLNIFDKQRHFSDKDFTCSIGKHDRIYLTFRNSSWKLFTSGDRITVTVDNLGVLRFGDPEKAPGSVPCFKLTKNQKGEPSVIESTRYTKITADKYPAIFNAAKKIDGNSFNFPKEDPPTVTVDVETKPKFTEEMKVKTNDMFEKLKVGEEKLKIITPEEVERDAFELRRKRLYTDATYWLKFAQSPEERTEIWKTLRKLYGLGGDAQEGKT